MVPLRVPLHPLFEGIPGVAAAFEEAVGRYREVGIDEFMLDQPHPEQLAVLERVAADVIARFRR